MISPRLADSSNPVVGRCTWIGGTCLLGVFIHCWKETKGLNQQSQVKYIYSIVLAGVSGRIGGECVPSKNLDLAQLKVKTS